MEDYLRLVEQDSSYNGFNRFEKVLMAVKRAKDIYDSEKPKDTFLPPQPHSPHPPQPIMREKKATAGSHKPTYRAMLEINDEKIKLTYEQPALVEEVTAEEPASEKE